MTLEVQNATVTKEVKVAMISLCVAVIALQIADGLSTYLAIATGKASEQNSMLVQISSFTSWSIMWVVFLAKLSVAGIFGVAMVTTKPTWSAVLAVGVVAAFYTVVVAGNMHWVRVFG